MLLAEDESNFPSSDIEVVTPELELEKLVVMERDVSPVVTGSTEVVIPVVIEPDVEIGVVTFILVKVASNPPWNNLIGNCKKTPSSSAF